MTQTARDLIESWWMDAWEAGLWAAAWKKSLDGLTAAQAAWRPPSAPGVTGDRHSIWQLVLHMTFWRESWLRRIGTGQKPTPEEIAAGNFPVVTDQGDEAWAAALTRFAGTQSAVAAAMREAAPGSDALLYFLPHDSYHFGQINYLRAMLGLRPIE